MSKLTPQTKWLLAIFVFILINGVVWYFGLSPALEKVKVVNNEYSQVEEQKVSLEQRMEFLNSIDAETMSQELEELNLQLPELGLLREFLIYLDQTTRDSGLILTSIPALTQTEISPYLSMNIRLEVIGSYQKIFDFIKILENHERLLLVKAFNLTSSDEGGISGGIDLIIYAEDFDQYTPYEAPGRNNPFEAN